MGEGSLALPQGVNGTNLVDFPEEVLPSLRSVWEMGWGEGEGVKGEEGELGLVGKNK